MSEELTKTQAKEDLDSLHPERAMYGSYLSQELPCQRVSLKSKKQWERSIKLAFFAEHGKHCGRGLQMSHRCRQPRDTSLCTRGTCIVGKHIDEQTPEQNLHRNQHQHLIQFYLKKIMHFGWKPGPYYVSDVPRKYVKWFFKEQGHAYKKVICDCKRRCFVNCKRFYLKKQQHKRKRRSRRKRTKYI